MPCSAAGSEALWGTQKRGQRAPHAPHAPRGACRTRRVACGGHSKDTLRGVAGDRRQHPSQQRGDISRIISRISRAYLAHISRISRHLAISPSRAGLLSRRARRRPPGHRRRRRSRRLLGRGPPPVPAPRCPPGPPPAPGPSRASRCLAAAAAVAGTFGPARGPRAAPSVGAGIRAGRRRNGGGANGAYHVRGGRGPGVLFGGRVGAGPGPQRALRRPGDPVPGLAGHGWRRRRRSFQPAAGDAARTRRYSCRRRRQLGPTRAGRAAGGEPGGRVLPLPPAPPAASCSSCPRRAPASPRQAGAAAAPSGRRVPGRARQRPRRPVTGPAGSQRRYADQGGGARAGEDGAGHDDGGGQPDAAVFRVLG